MTDHTSNAPALKVCSKCGEAKPLSDFHNYRDGLRPSCKDCTNAQNRSLYQKKRDEHLEAKRRYRNENPDARRKTLRAYDNNHSLARKAHNAVKHAIWAGKILPASECLCAECGQQASAYHHDSYERERWLDVRPLCRVCHGKEHQKHGA